jgi:hypothetical protein
MIANLVPCHCEFFSSGPSSSRSFSIAHVIVHITIYISVQKLTPTNENWLSYGSAKFDDVMASFEAGVCRALIMSIFDYFLNLMHIIVDNYTIHNRAKRGVNWTSLWCPISTSNAKVLAQRHLSWLCVVWEAYRIYLVEFLRQTLVNWVE